MRFLRFLPMVIAASSVAVLAACGSQHLRMTPPMTAQGAQSQHSSSQSTGRLMAAIGDTQAELLANIQEISAGGNQPAYVTVKTAKARHTYSVYAQFLRTAQTLIVRAYGHVSLFPLAKVQLAFGTSDSPVALIDLPVVQEPSFDSLMALEGPSWSSRSGAAGRIGGVGETPRDVGSGPVIAPPSATCPKCAALAAINQNLRSIAAKWNGLKDAWQVNPQYVAFAPASDSRHTMVAMTCDYSNAYCGMSRGLTASAPGSDGAFASNGDLFKNTVSGIGGTGTCPTGSTSTCNDSVAVIPGPPKPTVPCPQNDGSESIPVGGTLGVVNKNGEKQARSVSDINTVSSIAGTVIVNNHTVAINTAPIGWIYEDNNGGLWFQKDAAAHWSSGLTFMVTETLGINLNPPTSNSAIFVTPANARKLIDQQGVDTEKCFSQGGIFT